MTPRCVGCDQWKGGKRWRGRAGCPIPPGWVRTLPLREPPVDHSQSTLICILCYKQWGHLKDLFRDHEAGTDASKPPVSLPKTISKSNRRYSSALYFKKRQHNEIMSDASGDTSDYELDSNSDDSSADSPCSSDSASTWAPHSPCSQDLDGLDSHFYHTASSRSSSPFSYQHSYSHASRKGTPCSSLPNTPIGTPPSSSPLLTLFAARTNTAFPTPLNFSSIHKTTPTSGYADSAKRPKLAEV